MALGVIGKLYNHWLARLRRANAKLIGARLRPALFVVASATRQQKVRAGTFFSHNWSASQPTMPEKTPLNFALGANNYMTEPRKILYKMTGLVAVLQEDLSETHNETTRNDNQFNRRKYFRAASSFIDGMLYSLKQATLELHREFSVKIIKEKAQKEMPLLWNRMQPRLSPGEILLLEENIPDISKKGLPKLKPAYFPFDTNLKFSFRLFAHVFKSSYKPDYSNNDWNLLQASVKVRNRIIHPKSASDLEITNDEMSNLYKGLKWLVKSYSDLMGDFRRLLDELQIVTDDLLGRTQQGTGEKGYVH